MFVDVIMSPETPFFWCVFRQKIKQILQVHLKSTESSSQMQKDKSQTAVLIWKKNAYSVFESQ